jgi:hypothetical protein
MKALTESPRLVARIAGLFYILVFVGGIYSLFDRSGIGLAAAMVAGLFYIAVTVLFYFIFKPVSRRLSLLAAVTSLAGIVSGPLIMAVKPAAAMYQLVFFGFYCWLVALLIYRSTFLPQFLSAFMALAGLGWMTFVWPSFALSLSPYIFLPGIIGEGALTLWLVVFGVIEERWKEQLARSEQ